jgi:hypothetical protein
LRELGGCADFGEGEVEAGDGFGGGGLDVGGGFAQEVEVLDYAALEGEHADCEGFGHV